MHVRSTTPFIISILVFVAFVVLGCAKPQVMLDRAIVLNDTENAITDVRIFAEITQKMGETNVIFPQMTMDIGFSKQPMLAGQATVSWRDGAGVNRAVTLNLPYDLPAAQKGRIMNLIFEIHSSGTVTAHLDEAEKR